MTLSSSAIDAGEAAEERADYLEAAALYGTLLQDPDPVIVAEARFRLGRVAWRQGNYASALESFQIARLSAARNGWTDLRARAEIGIGGVHYGRGDYAGARTCYVGALALTADPTSRGNILMNLGVIANIEGDLGEAKRQYLESQSCFQLSGNLQGESKALANLGMLYADQVEWDAAEAAYARCLELSRETGNREQVGIVLMNRSELSCAMGNYSEAVVRCDAALAIFAEIGAEVLRGTALRWKGRALRELRDYVGAERALFESVRIAHRSRSQLLEAEAMQELAGTVALSGDNAEARRFFTRALVIFEALGATREAEEVRADLAALTGD